MTFYIKISPAGVPLDWKETTEPLTNYNTAAASAVNGKPYLVEATREGYEPFDPSTQVRVGPVLEASPPVIRYTVTTAPKPTVISYGAFQARFTALELDAITNYIFATVVATGLPVRPRVIQAYNRVVANDRVDLESPTTIGFMDGLVVAGIIDAARKAVLLTP